jgi:8-oxo-dGTP pyrophosphatase MutT (NUDIX family)
MSYLRHVEACNAFDPNAFLPFLLGDRRVGFIRRDKAGALALLPRIFDVDDRAVRLSAALDTATKRTAALTEASYFLAQKGAIGSIRGEAFAITDGWLGPLLFELDRGAVPFFGTRSYGVHLNGFRREGGDLLMWIGKRAPDKKIAPNRLDNLVAGGISSGYDAQETLVKEAGEEAGMPEALARRAWPVGAMMYRMQLSDGMRDDVLFSYDIELPPDFTPHNTDGEIADFRLMPLADCLRLVRESDEFKFNVNLVLIDFALRHGAIAPEHPHYLALLTGLRGGLIREAGTGAHLRG